MIVLSSATTASPPPRRCPASAPATCHHPSLCHLARGGAGRLVCREPRRAASPFEECGLNLSGQDEAPGRNSGRNSSPAACDHAEGERVRSAHHSKHPRKAPVPSEVPASPVSEVLDCPRR
jgi:hypothetical protein